MLAVARALEDGRWRGPLARLLASGWSFAASRPRALARPVALPGHVRTLAIGGATLGGSGKTPLAVACAAALAEAGVRVALVGHAYRARPRRARVVTSGDDLHEVGDEALVAAVALEPVGVPVVVAPSREDAVRLAAREAQVLVFDGVLQTRPTRATLSLLAVDADEPLGAAAVPPCGDLRAPWSALVGAADAIVRIGDGAAADASPCSRGASLGATLLGWDHLRRARVGLVCALARPARLLRFLERRGITPRAIVRAADHASLPRRALVSGAVDLWVATAKCALHAGPALEGSPAPVAVLDHSLRLSAALKARLACLDPRERRQYPQM